MAGTGNHLNIGVGLGNATLWNSEPAIQNFTNILAQKKAERDAERQQLINQMGSIDTTKLRPADREDYYNKFQDWQNTAVGAQNEKPNSYDKLLKQGAAQQKLNELKSFIAASAQAAAEHKQIGNQLLNDSFRHQFTDDAVNKYTQSNNLAMSNPNFISDPNTLERQVDADKIRKEFADFKTRLIAPTQYDNGTIEKGTNPAGEKGAYLTQKRGLPFADALHQTLNYADIKPEFHKFLDDSYKDIQGQSPSETRALRATQFLKDNGDENGFIQVKGDGRQFIKGQQDQRWTKLQQYYLDTFGVPYDPNAASHQTGAAAATPLTTNYIEPARVGGVQDVKKWLNMAPASQFRPGQKPTPSFVNGVQVINIPDQVQLDPKIVAANAKIKANYEKNPQKDGFMGMMGNPIPFEKSDKFKKIADPYKVIKPGYQETLDPNDPVGYHAKAGEISTELKIPVTAINHQAGGKGGRGINPGITNQKPVAAAYQHTQQGKNSKGDLITIGYKDGKWYDVKTNKPVE